MFRTLKSAWKHRELFKIAIVSPLGVREGLRRWWIIVSIESGEV